MTHYLTTLTPVDNVTIHTIKILQTNFQTAKSERMKEAWKKIQQDSNIYKIKDFYKAGLCFLAQGSQ